jgi:hypothetical protein
MWHLWAVTRYSRRPQDVATVRAFLIQASQRPLAKLPTYGEVAALYGGIARAVAPVLNSVALECRNNGEPDLSVLVVDAESRLPGNVGGEPVVKGEKSERLWLEELERVRKHWVAGTGSATPGRRLSDMASRLRRSR